MLVPMDELWKSIRLFRIPLPSNDESEDDMTDEETVRTPSPIAEETFPMLLISHPDSSGTADT